MQLGCLAIFWWCFLWSSQKWYKFKWLIKLKPVAPFLTWIINWGLPRIINSGLPRSRKSQGNSNLSESGKSQGILLQIREFLYFAVKLWEKSGNFVCCILINQWLKFELECKHYLWSKFENWSIFQKGIFVFSVAIYTILSKDAVRSFIEA